MKHKFTFFAVVMMALAMPLQAQNYDFSAVAPSGQTLYYKVTNGGASIVPPHYLDYGIFEEPTGALAIPDSVSWNDSTYAVVEIGTRAFRLCDSLTSVHIPSTVTKIQGAAFENCTSIAAVSGGAAVDTISAMAFQNCSTLTSFAMPESVVYIGQRAFWHCTGLTAVTIPEAVAYIGPHAFDSCSNLTTINFNATLYTGFGNAAFVGCDNVTALHIGDSVQRIPQGLFQGLQGLTSLVIPDAVTHIMAAAFYGLPNLTNLVIGSSVSHIGSDAFGHCTSLQQVNMLPQTPPTLVSYPFFYGSHGSQNDSVFSQLTISVPCGSGETYRAAEGWSNFTNIVELCDTLPCDTVQLPYFSDFSQCWTATGGATIIDSAHASIVSQGQKITSPWMVASAGRYFFHLFLERGENAEYNPNEEIRITMEDENGVFYTLEAWPESPFGNSVNLPNGLIRVSIEYIGSTSVPSLVVTGFAICNYAIDIITVGPSEASVGDTLTYIAHAMLQGNDTVDQWDWDIYDQERNRMNMDDPRLTLIGSTDSSRTFVLNSAGEYHVIARIWKTHYMSNLYILAVDEYYSDVYIHDTTSCDTVQLPYLADFNRCWTADNGAVVNSPQSVSLMGQGQKIESPWIETLPGNVFVAFTTRRDGEPLWDGTEYCLMTVENEDGEIYYTHFTPGDYSEFTPYFTSPGGLVRVRFEYVGSTPIPSFQLTNVAVFQYPMSLTIDCPGMASVGDTVTAIFRAELPDGDNYDYITKEVYEYATGNWIYDERIVAQTDTSLSFVINTAGRYGIVSELAKFDVFAGHTVRINEWVDIDIVDYHVFYEDSIYYTSAAKDTVVGCHPQLHNAHLPGSVRKLNYTCFNNHRNLQSIVIEDGLTDIEYYSFLGCSNLASVSLPGTLTHIGRYAFGRCSSLERIDLPQSLTALDKGVFWYCTSLDSLVFPDHIRTLGRNLMDSCISLTYVHLPDSLEYADTSLLRFCTALRHVDLPQHINRIEGWALMQCHSLESLDVPEGVTSIGETALYNDFNLSKLRLPSTLRSLGNIAMAYCQSLDTIWVAATTPPACTQNTFSYANGSATLVVPCGTAESYRSTLWSYFNIVEDCGTEGIGDVEPMWAVIAIQNGAIVVEGAEDHPVSVYDINGRLLATAHGEHAPLQFNVPASGTYLVKVGDHPARRVVVVR